MQEIFYEESVSLHNEKPAKRRYILFTVVAVLCVLFAVLMFFNIVFMPVADQDGNKFTKPVIITLIISAVFFGGMVFFAVFLFRKRHNFFAGYDYTYVSGELRICKVIHSRKRKMLYKLSDDRLIKIGRVGSESYKKLKASPDTKEEILTPNEEADEDKEFFYIQATTNVGKRLLILECRLQMIYTIVRYMRRNILESEFNQK